MAHVMVTGAQGFVGTTLVRQLLSHGLPGHTLDKLTLVDLKLENLYEDARVSLVEGSVADAAVRDEAFASPVDVVFHLASVPGGAAEQDHELGRRINLEATQLLLDDLGRQGRAGAQVRPRLVFASTVAVYGESLPQVVDESTLPAPALSYGAHKLASEILVADASRRGWVHGCSLRLPGVVARPGEGKGLMSAFMSQLFWKLAASQAITLPVSAHGVAWWISARACVHNLVHATGIESARWNPQRVAQMPALRLRMDEVVDALARRLGADRRALVSFEPDARIERLFASYPPLLTPFAYSLGFCHDGDADGLVANALLP